MGIADFNFKLIEGIKAKIGEFGHCQVNWVYLVVRNLTNPYITLTLASSIGALPFL